MKEFIGSPAHDVLMERWSKCLEIAITIFLDAELDEVKYPTAARRKEVNMIKSWMKLPEDIVQTHDTDKENRKNEKIGKKYRHDKTCLERK